MLNKELLAELKVILREEYGIDFSNEDIEELGNCLVNCFKILSESEESEND